MAQIEVILEVIDDVIPLYPELVDSNFKEVILKEYDELLKIKEDLYTFREAVRNLENKLKEKETTFNNKSQFFNIVYKTEIKQGVDKPEYADIMHVKGKVY